MGVDVVVGIKLGVVFDIVGYIPWPAAVVGDLVVGAKVFGATDGFAVGGFGSPLVHALLICPP